MSRVRVSRWFAAALPATLFLLSSGVARAQATITFDTRTSQAVDSPDVRVRSDERVTIQIHKDPLQSCVVSTAPLQPASEPDLATELVALLGRRPSGPRAMLPMGTLDPPNDDTTQQLALLNTEILGFQTQLDYEAEGLLRLVDGLAEYTQCGRCDAVGARARLTSLATGIAVSTQLEPPDGTSAIMLADTLRRALIARSGERSAWISQALAALRSLQVQLDGALVRRRHLVEARDVLAQTGRRVSAFAPAASMTVSLGRLPKGRTTVAVSCVNIVTRQSRVYQPNGEAIAVATHTSSITVLDPSRATLTAGALWSSLDAGRIEGASYKTGVDAAGVATVETRVTETARAGSQLVPFAFMNLVVPRLTLHRQPVTASVGLGVHSDSKGAVPDYFAGLGLGLGRGCVVTVGWHVGARQVPANAFHANDVVPGGLEVPTERVRKGSVAVGLSYGWRLR